MDFLSSTNICRCCLIKDENELLDLKETYRDGCLLSECFSMMTGIRSEDLELNSKLCNNCEYELLNAFKFRQKAVDAHRQLSKIKLEAEIAVQEHEISVKCEPIVNNVLELKYGLERHTNKGTTRRKRGQETVEPEIHDIKSDVSIKEDFVEIENRIEGNKRKKSLSKLPKRFECHHCGLISPKKRNLLTHLQRMHFKHLKKHLCDNCGQKFTSGAELNVHVRTIHKNEKVYQCNQCPKSYLYLQSLKVHLTTHSDARQFVCEICSASYKIRASLFNHKKLHTQPSREYTCKECGNRFTDKPTYEKHVNELHSADKKYCCSECGKRLKTKRAYEDHMRFHIGEFVKCPQCPKEYTTEYKLSKHILFTHSGQEKQFKCHLCPSAFHLMSNWKRHLKRVHK